MPESKFVVKVVFVVPIIERSRHQAKPKWSLSEAEVVIERSRDASV